MKKKLLITLVLFFMVLCIAPIKAQAKTWISASVTANTTSKTTEAITLTVKVKKNLKTISYVKYLPGDQSITKVKKSGKKLTYNKSTKKAKLNVTVNQKYTFVIKDSKGHAIKKVYKVDNYSNPKYLKQYKAIWYPFYTYENEYLSKYRSSNTEKNFRAYFKGVVKNCKSNNINTIIVHARAFGDAFYDSAYFPTSEYIAGTQGKKLSYDPLKVMVEEAHAQGLNIEAWLNPYRVAKHDDFKKLSKDHPARKWHESSKSAQQRNVLVYKSKIYFNPSSKEVQDLIIKGAVEIVNNYDVDAIHLDDYFYPEFTSSNYKTAFDAKEYNSSKEKAAGMSIVEYRRSQVNALVKGIHDAVHEADPDVRFGISPAGNIDNLTSKYSYYVDIEKWTKSTKYVDYITPQIYWAFNHSTAPFDKVLKRWKSITDQNKVDLYIGVGSYRVGGDYASNAKEKAEWKSSGILKKMIRYGREKSVDGFAFFEYEDLKRSKAKSAIYYMKMELQ
ncbi:MAG: family 10 glycosylhydrolase [Lachnospiraceae bacterium]|nr:family 10 glycosylhydrolase [Lachnospiraceae bacterium]